MHKKKTTLSIKFGHDTCRETSYVMVSDGKESFAIRATTRATPRGVGAIGEYFLKLPVLDLESFGTPFTHAYQTGAIKDDGISLLEQARFLHDQRMALAERIGAIKFAEIDHCVCRAIMEFKK